MSKDLIVLLALGLVGAGAVVYFKDRKGSAGAGAGDPELDDLYAAPPAPPVQDQGQNPGVAAGDTAPTTPTVVAPTAPLVPPSGGNTSADTLAYNKERYGTYDYSQSRDGMVGATTGVEPTQVGISLDSDPVEAPREPVPILMTATYSKPRTTSLISR